MITSSPTPANLAPAMERLASALIRAELLDPELVGPGERLIFMCAAEQLRCAGAATRIVVALPEGSAAGHIRAVAAACGDLRAAIASTEIDTDSSHLGWLRQLVDEVQLSLSLVNGGL